MTAAPLSVRCPTCKQKVIWNEQSPFKPFCSERCRLIDLGDWATEAHKIAGEPQAIELSGQPDGDLHY